MKKQEVLDIVDEKDNVIGQDTRENIFKKGFKNNIRVVNILIFNSKGKLLLPKRSNNRKLFPGCYDFSVGEHVFSKETYHAAAIRGLKEELGVRTEKIKELGKLTPRNGVNCFMKVYLLFYDGKLDKYDKNGIGKLSWYDLETIKIMIQKDRSRFKPDFPIVFSWYIKNFGAVF